MNLSWFQLRCRKARRTVLLGHLRYDLNVAQSALLAGLLQAPNVYDPTVNPELIPELRDVVLGTMPRF